MLSTLCTLFYLISALQKRKPKLWLLNFPKSHTMYKWQCWNSNPDLLTPVERALKRKMQESKGRWAICGSLGGFLIFVFTNPEQGMILITYTHTALRIVPST